MSVSFISTDILLHQIWHAVILVLLGGTTPCHIRLVVVLPNNIGTTLCQSFGLIVCKNYYVHLMLFECQFYINWYTFTTNLTHCCSSIVRRNNSVLNSTSVTICRNIVWLFWESTLYWHLINIQYKLNSQSIYTQLDLNLYSISSQLTIFWHSMRYIFL